MKSKRVVPGEDQLHGVEGGVQGVLVDEVIKGRVAPDIRAHSLRVEDVKEILSGFLRQSSQQGLVKAKVLEQVSQRQMQGKHCHGESRNPIAKILSLAWLGKP